MGGASSQRTGASRLPNIERYSGDGVALRPVFADGYQVHLDHHRRGVLGIDSDDLLRGVRSLRIGQLVVVSDRGGRRG